MEAPKQVLLFVDLSQSEFLARARLRERRQLLENIATHRKGGLGSDESDELTEKRLLLGSNTSVDPFFLAIVDGHAGSQAEGENEAKMVHGVLPTSQPRWYREHPNWNGEMIRVQNGPDIAVAAAELELVAIAGLMEMDNFLDPANPRFVQQVSVAQGEYRANRALFQRVFELLVLNSVPVTLDSQIALKLVDPAATDALHNANITADMLKAVIALSAKQLGAVVRQIAADGMTANDRQLPDRVRVALENVSGMDQGAPPSAIEIDLPDLEAQSDVEIVESNLHAVQALYFSYMLEELRLFQTVEKLVDLFRTGMLPIGKGGAGDYLYSYLKRSSERMNESERRDLYMRAFGAPGGDPNTNMPNREFNELWLRFVSAVSSYVRQFTVDNMLRSQAPGMVSQEQVRKAGRDLAANLSLHGYGIAYFAATELQSTIREFIGVLSDQDIKGSFGARDMWQVVEQVSASYLGGPRNSVRYRTQAQSGAVIIRWLAKNARNLSSSYVNDVIAIDVLRSPQLRSLGGGKATVDPTDWDLVNACEQWLAVGGIQEARIDEYSQPTEAPNTTSKPIALPSVAQDVLDSVGISIGA